MPFQDQTIVTSKGMEDCIEPGPAIGGFEMILMGAVLMAGLATCMAAAWLYRKITGKRMTPPRSGSVD